MKAMYGEDYYEKSVGVCERYTMGRCVRREGWFMIALMLPGE